MGRPPRTPVARGRDRGPPNARTRRNIPARDIKETFMTDRTTELEAAVYRRLRDHLRERTDVQNIELMNLSGFCRNCLSRWYEEAAAEMGMEMSKDEAREIVYGEPYKEWQAKYQKEATPEQIAEFERTQQQQ